MSTGVSGSEIRSAAAVLELLDRRGLGHWDLQSPPADASGPVPAVSVQLPDGTEVGVLACSTVVDLTDSQVAEIEEVASLIGSVLDAERRARIARARAAVAEAESVTDALTGLANRRGWWSAARREADRCARNGLSAVLAVVDLDGLKAINDTEGHLAGDVALRLTAQTLRSSVRPHDLVARLGGDEFAILAVDFEGPWPEALVARVRAGLAAAAIDASVGAAVHRPGAAVDATFRAADQAMYEVKRSHRFGPSA